MPRRCPHEDADDHPGNNPDGVDAAVSGGRTCSTLLKDGSILTAYGHYVSKGIALIGWKLPAAR